MWAPPWSPVELVLTDAPGEPLALEREGATGYHSLFVPDIGAGARYRFRLGGGGDLYPDPASRFQPEGPFGPSEVIDPHAFAWSDAGWRGIEPHRHVLYEMHMGTFTQRSSRSWPTSA